MITYSLRAGQRRIDLRYGSGEPVRVATQEWPGTDQTPSLAAGRFGSRRVARSDHGDGQTILGVRLDDVPGQGGIAINRVRGRDTSTATTTAGTQAAIEWPADITDRNPQVADLACEVRTSAAATVRFGVLRGITPVATVDVPVPAGVWTRLQTPAASIPGTSRLTLRVWLVASADGTQLQARCPVLGEGLDCSYHDEFTPGAELALAQNWTGQPLLAAGYGYDVSPGMATTANGPGTVPGLGIGGYRVACNPATPATRIAGPISTTQDDWMPVTAGQQVYGSVDVVTITTTADLLAYTDIVWRDSSGAVLSTTASATYDLSGPPGTHTMTVSGPAPAGAVFASRAAHIQRTSTGATDVWFTRVWTSDINRPYADGDTSEWEWLAAPGASFSRGPSGRVERAANGAEWYAAAIAALDELAGAIAADPAAARMIVQRDGHRDLTWSLHSGRVDPEESEPALVGYDRAKLTLSRAPFALAAATPITGAIESVAGVEIWTAATPVGGDEDAAGEISATWSTSRRSAIAIVTDAPPIAIAGEDLDRLFTTVTSLATSTGSANPNVLKLDVPEATGGPLHFAATPDPVPAGEYLVYARARVNSKGVIVDRPDAVNIALTAAGAELASTAVEPGFGGSTHPWQVAQFGRVLLDAPAPLTLSAEVLPAVFLTSAWAEPWLLELELDWLLLVPAAAAAAATITGPELTMLDPVAGDSPGGWTGTLTGGSSRAGNLGGTLEAINATVNWRREALETWIEPVIASGGSGAGGILRLGEMTTAAAAMQIRFRRSDSTAPLSITLGTDGAVLFVDQADVGDLVHIGDVDRAVVTSARIEANRWYDLAAAVDEAGRWRVWLADAGMPLQEIAAGQSDSLAGVTTWTLDVQAAVGLGATPNVEALLLRNVQPAGTSLTWSTEVDAGVLGDLPRLKPGTRPRVIMLAGDVTDSPLDPWPTSITLTTRERRSLFDR